MIKTNNKSYLLDTIMIYCNKFPNIGAMKLRNVVNGIHQTWDLICKTFPYIKFKSYDTNTSIKGTVALSGTRDPELTDKLTKNGWKVVDFNTKINLLIIPNDKFKSNKTESAIKHNIPIRTVDEMYNILN